MSKISNAWTPLDKEECKRRIESSFPSTYLTLISIIQGVALGILSQQLFSYESKNIGSLATLYGSRAPYGLISFLSLVIVTYEYLVLPIAYRYTYKLRDCVIIFLLGLFEIAPMFFLNLPRYFWSLNIGFSLCGVMAFVNVYCSCHKEAYTVRQIYVETKKKLKWDLFASTLALVYSGAVSIYAHNYDSMLTILGLVMPFIACQLLVLCKEVLFVRSVYRLCDLKW